MMMMMIIYFYILLWCYKHGPLEHENTQRSHVSQYSLKQIENWKLLGLTTVFSRRPFRFAFLVAERCCTGWCDSTETAFFILYLFYEQLLGFDVK